jgi:AcrR family transcriptional regulator
MDPEKVKIFFASLELFKEFGVKSVTMDQISQHCGISKKTLYKHVDNKLDLLHQTFELAAGYMAQELQENLSQVSGNAIDQLFALEQFAEKNLRGAEDRLLAQLDLYYPEVAQKVNEQRQTIVSAITRKNLEQGLREGLYREDINIDFIIILYYGHILAVHESVVGKDTPNLDELRKASLRYHIRGIASLQGLEYLNQRIHSNI